MPSAATHQRELMTKWFGSFDDCGPTQFLLARGWIEEGGKWRKPTPSYTISAYECECIRFLRDEWDHDWSSDCFFFTDVYDDAGIDRNAP